MSTVQPKYAFFISHISEDRELASKLYKCLPDSENSEKSAFACYIGGGELESGKFILHGISQAIQNSDMVIVLLTPEAMSSMWVKIEVLLAWNKSVECKRNCLKLLFYGQSKDDENCFRRKFTTLPEICFGTLPTNTSEWDEASIGRLVQSTDDEFASPLSLGSIGYGLANNYTVGYLFLILKELCQGIEDHVDEEVDKRKMPRRFYVILPENETDLEKYLKWKDGNRMKAMKNAIYFPCDVGGVKRKKDAPVYRLQDEETGQEYFIVGEIPSVIRPLEQIKELTECMEVNKPFELARFISTLEELLYYCDSPIYNCVEIVTFNDEKESLVDKLLPIVKKDLERDSMRQRLSQAGIPGTVATRGATPVKESVVILCGADDDSGKRISSKMSELLARSGVKTTAQEGTSFLQLNFNWCLVILTKEGLCDEDLMNNLNFAYGDSVYNKVVKVVCITYEVDFYDINFPMAARLSHCHKYEEGKTWERLVTCLKGENPKMEGHLTSGNVAIGLGWAFVLNYLLINTKELGKRMREKFCDHDGDFFPKLLVLFPKSCTIPDEIRCLPGEEALANKLVHEVGPRKYYLQCFKRTMKTGQTIIYPREYSTPSKTLYSMATEFEWAGLTKRDMETQQKLLADTVELVIKREDVKKKIGNLEQVCEIVFFDDSEDGSLEHEVETRLQKYINSHA